MEPLRKTLPDISPETKRTWQRTRHDHSAGGVAYRRLENPAMVEIALIATRGGKRWQLPKGSCEENESSLETAIREVEEEVGLRTESKAYLRSIDYWYWDTYRKEIPILVHKTVDFFLLRVVGGVLNDECYEVDAVGWFAIEQALNILTFQGELKVVEHALTALNGGGYTVDGNS